MLFEGHGAPSPPRILSPGRFPVRPIECPATLHDSFRCNSSTTYSKIKLKLATSEPLEELSNASKFVKNDWVVAEIWAKTWTSRQRASQTGREKGVCVCCVCCVCCLFVCLKSITCTLVQNGRFLAATGYVAPSPRPYNKEKNVVYQIIMYLKSHIKLNHGNPIQSQPHGPETLSAQNTEEKKLREIQRRRRKTLHPIENPRIPCTPQETPKPYHNWLRTPEPLKQRRRKNK